MNCKTPHIRGKDRQLRLTLIDKYSIMDILIWSWSRERFSSPKIRRILKARKVFGKDEKFPEKTESQKSESQKSESQKTESQKTETSPRGRHKAVGILRAPSIANLTIMMITIMMMVMTG